MKHIHLWSLKNFVNILLLLFYFTHPILELFCKTLSKKSITKVNKRNNVLKY